MLKDLNPSFKLPAFETGYFRVSLLECACILRMTELIYGAGGHGKVLFGIAQEVGINIDYFVDDEEAGQQIAGVPVLSPFEAGELKCFSFIIGIGSNPARWRVFHPLFVNHKRHKKHKRHKRYKRG